MMIRFTIQCDSEELILAARAAKYGATEMPYDMAVCTYGDTPEQEVAFLVRRTRAGGISVRQSDKARGIEARKTLAKARGES